MKKWIFIFFILSLFLRSYNLFERDIWVDEYLSVKLTSNSIFNTLIKTINLNQTDPPVYPIIIHILTKLTKDPYVLRISSVIFGFLALILLYYYSLLLFDKKTAFITLLLSVFSSYQIYLSQELRYHAFLFFICILHLIFFEKFKQNKNFTYFWILTLIIMIYTSFIAVGILIAEILWIIITFKKKKECLWLISSSIFFYGIWIIFQLKFGKIPTDTWITINSIHYNNLYTSTIEIFKVFISGFSFNFYPFIIFTSFFILFIFSCIHLLNKKKFFLLFFIFIIWLMLIISNSTIFSKPPLRHAIIFYPFFILILSKFIKDKKKFFCLFIIIIFNITNCIHYYYNKEQIKNGITSQLHLLKTIKKQNEPIITEEKNIDDYFKFYFDKYDLKLSDIKNLNSDKFYVMNFRYYNKHPENRFKKIKYYTLFSYPLYFFGKSEKCFNMPSLHYFTKNKNNIKNNMNFPVYYDLSSLISIKLFKSKVLAFNNKKEIPMKKNNDLWSAKIKSGYVFPYIKNILFDIQRHLGQSKLIENMYQEYIIKNNIFHPPIIKVFFLLDPIFSILFFILGVLVIIDLLFPVFIRRTCALFK